MIACVDVTSEGKNLFKVYLQAELHEVILNTECGWSPGEVRYRVLSRNALSTSKLNSISDYSQVPYYDEKSGTWKYYPSYLPPKLEAGWCYEVSVWSRYPRCRDTFALYLVRENRKWRVAPTYDTECR